VRNDGADDGSRWTQMTMVKMMIMKMMKMRMAVAMMKTMMVMVLAQLRRQQLMHMIVNVKQRLMARHYHLSRH
jgi:hypothetical protein